MVNPPGSCACAGAWWSEKDGGACSGPYNASQCSPYAVSPTGDGSCVCPSGCTTVHPITGSCVPTGTPCSSPSTTKKGVSTSLIVAITVSILLLLLLGGGAAYISLSSSPSALQTREYLGQFWSKTAARGRAVWGGASKGEATGLLSAETPSSSSSSTKDSKSSEAGVRARSPSGVRVANELKKLEERSKKDSPPLPSGVSKSKSWALAGLSLPFRSTSSTPTSEPLPDQPSFTLTENYQQPPQ